MFAPSPLLTCHDPLAETAFHEGAQGLRPVLGGMVSPDERSRVARSWREGVERLLADGGARTVHLA